MSDIRAYRRKLDRIGEEVRKANRALDEGEIERFYLIMKVVCSIAGSIGPYSKAPRPE